MKKIVSNKKIYYCYYVCVIVGIISLWIYTNEIIFLSTSVSDNYVMDVISTRSTTGSGSTTNGIIEEMILLDEFNTLLSLIQGNDYRIMRWDTTKYTQQQQQLLENGPCSTNNLQKAFSILLDKYVPVVIPTSTSTTKNNNNDYNFFPDTNLFGMSSSSSSSSSTSSSSSSSSSTTKSRKQQMEEQKLRYTQEGRITIMTTTNGTTNGTSFGNNTTTIVKSSSSTSSSSLLVSSKNTIKRSILLKSRVLEYLTFCITDNQPIRELFSQQDGIHQKIIDIASRKESTITLSTTTGSSSKDDTSSILLETIQSELYASAMACHLLYISCFNNYKNHNEYIKSNAIQVLSSIIKNRQFLSEKPQQQNSTSSTGSSIIPLLQIMWAQAAIQNLAASYCTTDDGRCVWDWIETTTTDDKEKEENDDTDKNDTENQNQETKKQLQLVVRDDNLPFVIDSEYVRNIIVNDTDLMNRLIYDSCTYGPSTTDNIILPGEYNSPIKLLNNYNDNDSISYYNNIISWSATGALKNIAISSTVQEYIQQYHISSLKCICQLSHSIDWLESNKGYGIIYMLYTNDPCWFTDNDIEESSNRHIYATQSTEVCIDSIYYRTDITTDIDTDTDSDKNDNDESSSSTTSITTCSNFPQQPTTEQCTIVDNYNTDPMIACCSCGGGTRY